MIDCIECDSCTQEAEWLAYAAYTTDERAIHPEVAHYPMPMVRACSDCFLELIKQDLGAQGSTKQYVMRKLS